MWYEDVIQARIRDNAGTVQADPAERIALAILALIRRVGTALRGLQAPAPRHGPVLSRLA